SYGATGPIGTRRGNLRSGGLGNAAVSRGLPTFMTRIAVLTGGSTAEREVAFAGAAQVVAALRGTGAHVSVVDPVSGLLSPADEARLLVTSVGRTPPSDRELAALKESELGPAVVEIPALRDADLAFLVIHGRQGEGGELQALLDLAGIPYTGSDLL